MKDLPYYNHACLIYKGQEMYGDFVTVSNCLTAIEEAKNEEAERRMKYFEWYVKQYCPNIIGENPSYPNMNVREGFEYWVNNVENKGEQNE